MTDNEALAASWIAGLSIEVRVVHGRLRFLPEGSYHELTDDEILTLRHHRSAIRSALAHGVTQNPVTGDVTADAVMHAVASTPTSAPPPCRFCMTAPCIGPDHPAFATLHDADPERRDDAETAIMFAQIAQPLPDWYRR